jgi:hypothetical protein
VSGDSCLALVRNHVCAWCATVSVLCLVSNGSTIMTTPHAHNGTTAAGVQR